MAIARLFHPYLTPIPPECHLTDFTPFRFYPHVERPNLTLRLRALVLSPLTKISPRSLLPPNFTPISAYAKFCPFSPSVIQFHPDVGTPKLTLSITYPHLNLTLTLIVPLFHPNFIFRSISAYFTLNHHFNFSPMLDVQYHPQYYLS